VRVDSFQHALFFALKIQISTEYP